VIHPDHDRLHVPELLVERYRLGEMSPSEHARFRRLLETDEELRRRLRALEDSDKEIGRRYPADWLAARIQERLGREASPTSQIEHRRSFSWRTRITVAATTVIVLAVGWRILGPPEPTPTHTASNAPGRDERIKGRALALFRKTAEGSELLSDGARASAGDQIRIGYRAAGRSYGVILSIDGRGVVTRHFPLRGEEAAPLSREGLVLLDHAYELDDAPGWERFYLVTGGGAFRLEPVLKAAQTLAAKAGSPALGKLALSPPLEQTSFVLIKEAAR